MDFNSWLNTCSDKFPKKYRHFDNPISLVERKRNLLTNPEEICRHSFYPLIKIQLRKNKLKKLPLLSSSSNGLKPKVKRDKPKIREILLCSHIDSLIYSYYAFLLSEEYETYLRKNHISDFPIAYRKLNGKCNIEFSHEAIEHIKNQKNGCWILLFDFKDFFGSLNHLILKQKIQRVLNVENLSKDWFSVFKNITKYSFIDQENIFKIKGIPEGERKKTLKTLERWFTPHEFRQLSCYINKNSSGIGIPQGSPISAILSNVYMIDFDQELAGTISGLKGFYRRYSDDFIVVIPKSECCEPENIKNKIMFLAETYGLKIEEHKTKIFYFNGRRIFEKSGSQYKTSILTFLGFSFNGRNSSIKSGTISRGYNKLLREAKILEKLLDKYEQGLTKKVPPVPNNLRERILYIKNKKKISTDVKDKNCKKKNFITYGYKASKVFNNNEGMLHAMRNLRNRIGAKLRRYRKRRALAVDSKS